jgi:hypothetical protein
MSRIDVVPFVPWLGARADGIGPIVLAVFDEMVWPPRVVQVRAIVVTLRSPRS